MNQVARIAVCFCLVFLSLSCNDKKENDETILKGKATIYVDETIAPIVEDQVAVFESDYDAEITIIAQSEGEIVQAISTDSAKIVILARDLSNIEKKVFEQRQIVPRTTMFGTDAIALIANKQYKDTVVSLTDVIAFMNGNRSNSAIKGLVFDNPNSSTVRYMNELAKSNVNDREGIFSFKSNEEVIKFVSENKNMIGVVGLSWLTLPTAAVTKYRPNINILSVKGIKSDVAYFPNQSNLAEGKYPLARDLYIVGAQGYSGLGVGFSSFIAGERGQRIILKSGLLPIRIPPRKILTRKKIETKNNN